MGGRSPEEWWHSRHERSASVQYREWDKRCETVAKRFGLAKSTVVMACLLEDYQPYRQPHRVEADGPRVTLVTDSQDPQFVVRLAWEAQRRGLHVVQRYGAVENEHFVSMMTDEPPPLPTSIRTPVP